MSPSLKRLLDGFQFDGALGADFEEIENLEKIVGRTLPEELREILNQGNGVTFTNEYHTINLFSVEQIRSYHKMLEEWGNTRDYLVIGSTGGGENYVLDYQVGPPSVVLVPAIGHDYISAIPLAPDFRSLMLRLKSPVGLFEGVTAGITRLPFAQSCDLIAKYGDVPADLTLSLNAGVPQYDDELSGVSFFRTRIYEVRWERLTLPRTFFGRSEIEKSSFAWSDFTESNLCWNDFKEVCFKGTLLKGADLRASTFRHCNFNQSDLTGADLRRSTFVKCNFGGAKLTNAIIPWRLRFSHSGLSSLAKVVFREGSMPIGG
jgi:hypothetical protein